MNKVKENKKIKQKKEEEEKNEYLNENAVLMCSSEWYESPFVVEIESADFIFLFLRLHCVFLFKKVRTSKNFV